MKINDFSNLEDEFLFFFINEDIVFFMVNSLDKVVMFNTKLVTFSLTI